MERERSGVDLARGNLKGRRGSIEVAGGIRRRGLRRVRARARLREEREKPSARSPGRGLYAPAAGSPDALKVAPDASGDHRTHAQRGLQIGTAPDYGHRTLALASGAPGHAR